MIAGNIAKAFDLKNVGSSTAASYGIKNGVNQKGAAKGIEQKGNNNNDNDEEAGESGEEEENGSNQGKCNRRES